MLKHLRKVFELLWAWLSTRGAANAAKAEQAAKGLDRTQARADFWTEFSEGQREAAARASKRR